VIISPPSPQFVDFLRLRMFKVPLLTVNTVTVPVTITAVLHSNSPSIHEYRDFSNQASPVLPGSLGRNGGH
jgi:hypothetical protein